VNFYSPCTFIFPVRGFARPVLSLSWLCLFAVLGFCSLEIGSTVRGGNSLTLACKKGCISVSFERKKGDAQNAYPGGGGWGRYVGRKLLNRHLQGGHTAVVHKLFNFLRFLVHNFQYKGIQCMHCSWHQKEDMHQTIIMSLLAHA